MKSIFKTTRLLLCALSVGCLMTACDSDMWEFKDENKGAYLPAGGDPIATMLDKEGTNSEWIHVLEYSNTYSALNQGTDGIKFTAFVPSDSALQVFYQSLGVSGIEEMGVEYAEALVMQHTYSGDSLKLSEKFGQGIDSLIYENVAGEELVFKIDTVNTGFMLNNVAHVDRNYQKASNGFIYYMSGVTVPLVETIYDRVADNPDYGIMTDLLKATGYDQKLSVLADTVVSFGELHITKHNYTLLAVSDESFAKHQIATLDDLKASLKARTTDEVSEDSLLKQYVQYHLFDAPYTKHEMQSMLGSDSVRIWEPLAPNQIMMVTNRIVSIDSTLVLDEETGEEKYAYDTTMISVINAADIPAQFVTAGCDQLAKNGYVQEIDSWLPVYEPEQSVVVWDLADYAEVRNAVGLDYHPAEPVSSEAKVPLSVLSCYEYELGPEGYVNNNYAPVTYVTCKNNLKECLYYDRVVFNLGYQGFVSMKTPTLVRGKYKVTISMAYLTELSFLRTSSNCKGGMMKISMDGAHESVVAPYTTITKSLAGVYEATLYDEIEFTETSSHIFKFVVMDPAASTNSKFSLQFDAITFTPITE